jgi:hypothetical protein
MDSGKEIIDRALQLTKSIQSLDDLNEHKDEIIAIIEDFIRLGLESLKDIIKMSLSPADTKKRLDKFQADQELFNTELELELNRIAEIDGAQEFIDSLKDEMEKRLEPIAEEMATIMGQIMSSMMGQMMNGFSDLISDSIADVEDTDDNGHPKEGEKENSKISDEET